ncbi:MAG: Ig-like domain-containing protein [Desulfamplus sp.]
MSFSSFFTTPLNQANLDTWLRNALTNYQQQDGTVPAGIAGVGAEIIRTYNALGTDADIPGYSGPGDVTPPQYTIFSPADNAANVAVSSNITINFNESIKLGTGVIGVYDVGTDTLVPAAVSVNGAALTINPTADLANSTAYYVNIAAGAIEDIAGNDFAGITGETTFNFTTVAGSGGGTIGIGSTATFTATADVDNFTFAAQAALAATGTVSQAVIAQFSAANDTLEFDLPTATGVINLGTLNGLQGVSVEYNDLDNNTLINFGLDADGDAVTITLNGIVQADWASVNVTII